MSTLLAIKSLERQVTDVTAKLNQSVDKWQTQAGEERAATEERIKSLEDTLAEVKGLLEDRRRETLPGSEPNERTGEAFSLSRACVAISQRNWDGAGFEKEVFDNMRAQQRAMSSGIDSAGGFVVPDNAIPQVIERLKAETVVLRLGAREIPATGAPVTIPRISGSGTATWMSGENQTIAASDLTLQEISMTPKSLGARVILSNQLMELSQPAADSIIENDLVSELTIGLDKGALEGTGGAQPLGVINDDDVLTEAISATVTYEEMVGFVDALAQANSLRGRLGWAMHPALFTQLMKLKSENAATPTANLEVTRHAITDSAPDSVLGYPFATTTSFSASTDANSVVFGNWDDLLIAMWGGLRLRASDLSDDAFSKDQTHVRAIMRADTALRHPESFCRAT